MANDYDVIVHTQDGKVLRDTVRAENRRQAQDLVDNRYGGYPDARLKSVSQR